MQHIFNSRSKHLNVVRVYSIGFNSHFESFKNIGNPDAECRWFLSALQYIPSMANKSTSTHSCFACQSKWLVFRATAQRNEQRMLKSVAACTERTHVLQKARVTRLGEYSPIGRLFSFWHFSEN
jgi:hypothetical protein